MFDYIKAISRCVDNNLKVLMKKIQNYQEYCMFFDVSVKSFSQFKSLYPHAPNQIMSLYKFTDGGMLFDTVLFSTERIDMETMFSKIKIENLNEDAIKTRYTGCPKELTAFGMASFGDLYCFYSNGSEEIVQWSVSENKIVYKWTNLYAWLNNEINGAIELISEEILHPLGYYLEELQK